MDDYMFNHSRVQVIELPHTHTHTHTLRYSLHTCASHCVRGILTGIIMRVKGMLGMNLNPSVYHTPHPLNIMCASDRQRELRLLCLHAFTRTNKTSAMWHRVCAENSTTEHWNAMHMILAQVKRLHFSDDSICTLQANFIKYIWYPPYTQKNISNRIWFLFIYCFYLYF